MASVDDIIDKAVEVATEQQQLVSDAVNIALGIATGGVSMTSPDPFFTEVLTETLENGSGGNIMTNIPLKADESAIYNNFNAVYNKLYNQAVRDFANFLNTYFPVYQSFYKAEQWLQDTIDSNGDILQSVEDHYWANDRNRITAEHLKLENKTLSQFAARGFPLPNGALTAQLQELNIQRSNKLAEVSHQAAIKHIDIAADMIKFAVSEALKLRIAAINAAIAYIRALLQPADVASHFVIQTGGLQAQLISATASYYRAALARDELFFQRDAKKAELTLGYTQASLALLGRDIESRTRAAVGGASSAAEMAKGAMSSLNAIGATITNA